MNGRTNVAIPYPQTTNGFLFFVLSDHQPLASFEGQATDVEIRVRYMLKLKQRLNGIISKHTGKSIEQVEKDTDRDNFMTPEEAKAYGLVDEVVQSRKEIPNLAEHATSLADKKE